MSQREDPMAYGDYPGQEEGERGLRESARGLIGETVKFLKETYKSHHHGQQQTYDPSSYSVSPPSSSISGRSSNHSLQTYPRSRPTLSSPRMRARGRPRTHPRPSKSYLVSWESCRTRWQTLARRSPSALETPSTRRLMPSMARANQIPRTDLEALPRRESTTT